MTQAINGITRDDVAHFESVLDVSRQMTADYSDPFDVYQEIALKSAIYPGSGTPLGLIYVALKGAGEAGEFAEHVGKAMRDDDIVHSIGFGGYEFESLTPERYDKLLKECGDELWYLAAKCRELGTTLSQVALMNLEKLCDRGERGTLQGSGDDR